MARHKLIDTDEVYALYVGDKLSMYAIAKRLKVDQKTIKYHIDKKKTELEAQND